MKALLFLRCSTHLRICTRSISKHAFFIIQIKPISLSSLNQAPLASPIVLLPQSSSSSANKKSLTNGYENSKLIIQKCRLCFLLAYGICFSRAACPEVRRRCGHYLLDCSAVSALGGGFKGRSMVFNQSFLFTRSRMYNSFAMACQPYCLMQMPQPSYPQFLMQSGDQFFLPQFLPLLLPHQQAQMMQNDLKTEPSTSVALADPNEAKAAVPARALQKITQGRQVIKEKIIKKPANRPATYLTERRFYQAQSIEEEASAGRRLRPRIFKKRTIRPLESQPSSGKHQGAELQRADSPHKEAGSSELLASQTKKGSSCAEPLADSGCLPASRSADCLKESSVEQIDR